MSLTNAMFWFLAPVDNGGNTSGVSAGVIAAIVIVIIFVIAAIVVVSIILCKRGHCHAMCGHVNGCLGKISCWKTCKNKVCVCCKNRVAESEKPIITSTLLFISGAIILRITQLDRHEFELDESADYVAATTPVKYWAKKPEQAMFISMFRMITVPCH